MANDLREALTWVTDLLEELGIAYQVVGGLAARCHGATRPLVDIDLYVPDRGSLERIASAAEHHLTRAPASHRDEHWDLTFLALDRNGWRIEIAAAEDAKVWNQAKNSWTPAAIRFDEPEIVTTSGIELCVIPKEMLIRYKTGLDRKVDRLDLRELRVGSGSRLPEESA